MELQDLKQKWNMLDERLSKSEVYNKRALEEVIKGKNKTTYEKLQKQGMFNFFVTLSIASVILPLLYSKGIFRDTSFYILEIVCLLGVVMVACRLTVLYRFNVMKTPTGNYAISSTTSVAISLSLWLAYHWAFWASVPGLF